MGRHNGGEGDHGEKDDEVNDDGDDDDSHWNDGHVVAAGAVEIVCDDCSRQPQPGRDLLLLTVF